MQKDKALTRITEGVRRFQEEIFPEQREMFERLRSHQDPLVLVITCSDSRIVPNLITQTEPGEIFIERNPGNLVPEFEPFVGGVTSSIEYAMLVLRVPLIIVCGHTDCGVMKALLNPASADGLPGVKQWMRHADRAREKMMREHGKDPEQVKLKYLTQYNVLAQMENVKSHPSVKARVEAGEVDVYGWVYDIGSGTIWQADPATGLFADTRKLTESTPRP